GRCRKPYTDVSGNGMPGVTYFNLPATMKAAAAQRAMPHEAADAGCTNARCGSALDHVLQRLTVQKLSEVANRQVQQGVLVAVEGQGTVRREIAVRSRP